MPPVVPLAEPPALYAPAISTQSSGSAFLERFGSSPFGISWSVTDWEKRDLLDRVQRAARSSLIDVGEDTLYYAFRFAQLLPTSTPLPDVVVDDDGEVAFDWGTSARSTFTVSVGRGGLLRFAGLFNGRTRFGADQLTSTIPAELLAYVVASMAVEVGARG